MAVHNILNLAGPATKTIKALFIPLATIIGHGIYIVLKFLN
jgi:hypothetical protein